jgi:sugar lactone lactonase YvrE
VLCALALIAFGPTSVPTTSATAADPPTAVLRGVVQSDSTSLGGYRVRLMLPGGGGAGPTELGAATSESDGTFTIDYPAGFATGSAAYVTATDTPSGAGAITLASVLGPDAVPSDIVIDERTTVATAYAMTQFADGDALSGTSPGLPNAIGMAHDLVNVITGDPGSVLTSSPNGAETSTLGAFNSLANMVARCVSTSLSCAELFALVTPDGGTTPTTTFQALVDINRNPSHHAAELFAFAPTTPYSPSATEPPDAWTLALRFFGDGHSVDGPGNLVVDAHGNVWVTNNYEYAPDAQTPVCGGKALLAFSPAGQALAGTPYTGGGLDGAGFGIDIDPFGDIWAGNYGFAAPEPDCPAAQQPAHDSVSQFRPDGTAVSPASGFSQGGVSWPQGTKSDSQGNIWIANCEANSVTLYPHGEPSQVREIRAPGLDKPFGIAHDPAGNAYVTNVEGDSVVVLQPDGTPAPESPITGGGLNRPLGVAADLEGNQWIANSGLVDIPCPTLDDLGSVGGSVTLVRADGTVANSSPFTGGGLTVPWGVAVDGDDHVWVANFAGKRLSEFCGVRIAACPAGTATGDPISPDEGYGFDGLVRNTGLAVDPSGNVWVANNWKEDPVPTNPGGYEIVAFVGVATPVQRAAPLARPTAPTLVPRFTG